MNAALEIAGVGLGTQQRALDVIANNIANINTPSFKRSELRFSEIVASRRDPNNVTADLRAPTTLAGVSATIALALDEQGELERTGRALDIAIQGGGFIELMGPNGQTLLWRGGALSVQDDGLLATADGIALRAAITVPSEATEVSIGADGMVTARAPGNAEAVELGQITLVRVNDPSALERLDGGLYRLSEDAQPSDLIPGQDGGGEIVQGAIERSNVRINDEMIRLMIVQRAYTANAQVVQAADQLMAIANGLRR